MTGYIVKLHVVGLGFTHWQLAILWHEAVRLVGPACCRDACVAAVRMHARSVPESVLHTCVVEQAMWQLHSLRTFVRQALVWFTILSHHSAFRQYLAPVTNTSQQCMPVSTADLSAALENSQECPKRSASTKSAIKVYLISLLVVSKFSLLCNSNPLSDHKTAARPLFMQQLIWQLPASRSCWSFAGGLEQWRNWTMQKMP